MRCWALKDAGNLRAKSRQLLLFFVITYQVYSSSALVGQSMLHLGDMNPAFRLAIPLRASPWTSLDLRLGEKYALGLDALLKALDAFYKHGSGRLAEHTISADQC